MGKPVNAPNDLQSLIARQRPGDTVAVGILREGVERTLDVTLMGEDTSVYQEWLSELRSGASSGAESPEYQPPDNSDESAITELDGWDVGLRPLSDAEESVFGVDAGAYVAYVENGGRAAAAGLPRNVVITHLNDTRVASPTEAVQYLSGSGGSVLVQVQRRDGTPAFYEIE
jgi:S1-C subfamily serine protease